MSRRWFSWSVAALAVVVTGTVVPAAQANFLAAGPDPAGDATDPSPGRDVVGAALAYDRRAGTVRGGVALRGAPTGTSGATIAIIAGVRTPAGCTAYPAIGLSSPTTGAGAEWSRFDAAGPPAATGQAAKDGAGTAVQMIEVADAALAGRAVDCIEAGLADPADPRRLYDSTGPLTLKPRPQLAAKLGRPPAAMRLGQKRKIRLTLRNGGDASTGRLKLSIARQPGLTARAARTVKALKAGQRRTVSVEVTLGRRAKATTPLRVTVTAGDLRVRETASLYRRKRSGGSGSGTGTCASYAPVLGGVGDVVVAPC
ncbi:NEW3 domain-containing protein [Patulibacter medicamentivorans]|uniref:NEW3 domain-containing protein n=1 Tax=Patulibacter medicamentivorans TaxID=1097667 RepID=UPI003CC73764